MKRLLTSLLVLLLAFHATKASCPSGYSEIIIRIVPDSWPQEISWQLSESGGALLQSGTSTGDTVCVPDASCLEFVINDSYGDGIYSPGGYWLYVNGLVVDSGNAYGYQDMVALDCPAGMHCTAPLPMAYGSQWSAYDDTWYTFTPDSSGMYSLNTCDSNTCNTQLWVYTSCPSLPYTEGPMGSYVYNDDNNCGTQANMSFMLVAGTTYLIRVGDNLNACADSIWFDFQYSGPITGCMDPSACNFNPLATVADNSCIYYPNPMCQGPDLRFDSLSFVSSMVLQTFTASACDVAEGCLMDYGTRYVISFTSKIDNIGTQDYYIGNPSTQPGMFNSNNCHGHSHYEGYGDYRLYDTNNNLLPAGHKNGYCVIDLCGMGQYTCGNMGISAGCYDAYGVGTQCQWVDITDVPDGDYRLAILINSQHLPDALGRYETNFLNNALQVCIRITRNLAGVPSYSLLPNCTPFVDCNGVPGGVSTMDCSGTCGGTTVTGDVNADGTLDPLDVTGYMDQVQGQFTATPCSDLNGDGEITVFDAAQANWCYYGNPNVSGGTHNHCNFPRNITSTADTNTLRLVNFDAVNNSVDVELLNPRLGVKGYQFTLEGVVITSVVNMINPIQFPADVRFIASTNEVFGFGLNDSTIPRAVLSRPIVRIFFSNITDTAICISRITAIMNERGEGTTALVAGGCMPLTSTGVFSTLKPAGLLTVPNPATQQTRLHVATGVKTSDYWTLTDITGREFQLAVNAIDKEWFNLDLTALPPGVYVLRICDGEFAGSTRIVKL